MTNQKARILTFVLSFCILFLAFCPFRTWYPVLTPDWLGETEKVSQEVVSCFGEDRFRMKLDPLHYILPVPHPHYYAFGCPGSDFETGWKPISFDNQRMVTCCRKGIGQALVDSLAIVMDSGGLAVDGRTSSNLAAVDRADALMSQAHSQYGDSPAEVPHYLVGDARF